MSLPLVLKGRIAKSGTAKVTPGANGAVTSELLIQVLGTDNPTVINNAQLNFAIPLSGLIDPALAAALPTDQAVTLSISAAS